MAAAAAAAAVVMVAMVAMVVVVAARNPQGQAHLWHILERPMELSPCEGLSTRVGDPVECDRGRRVLLYGRAVGSVRKGYLGRPQPGRKQARKRHARSKLEHRAAIHRSWVRP